MDKTDRIKKTKVKPFLIEGTGKKGCWRVPAESETVDRAPRRRPGKGGRCSLLALSINRYICISLYSHRASSSRAKRLACQVAKALMEALEAGSPLPFAQPPRNRIL